MNISLLEQTNCKNFFHAVEISPKIQALKADVKDLQSFAVEPLDDMLHGESESYPYEGVFSQACWDPILVLHSSGSTGNSLLAST